MIGVKQPIPGVIYPPESRLQTYLQSNALPSTTLVQALSESFKKHAANIALYTPASDISYGELDRITDCLAAALLKLGLQPLDRVLFQSENCPEVVIALLACLKAGLIPVCTLAPHRENEIGYLGRHVDARAHFVQGNGGKYDLEAFALEVQPEIPTMRHIISLSGEPRPGVLALERLIDSVEPEAARAMVDAVYRDPFQVAIFQLSGGTTGTPKVIPRMQNDYLLNADLTREALGYRQDDVMLMPMPIMHNACMICCLLPCLLTGAAFVLPADMTAESWADIIRRCKPSFIFLIKPLLPRFEASMALVPEAITHVRAFWSADSARALRAKYGKPAYGMFGMSEGMNMYCRPGDPDEALDWTVGYPLSRYDEVKIVRPGTEEELEDEEIGEMICRGPYTLSGYYNAPERNETAFTDAGYYNPSDLMIRRKINGKHYFAFAGRTKDVVDRGTEKINCEEVENAVSTYPGVSACAIVGMPDPHLGERVCAYLVLGGKEPIPAVLDLQQHLKRLGFAKFKWPERIEIVTELPLTKVGKLDKASLRQSIADKLEMEAVAPPGGK